MTIFFILFLDIHLKRQKEQKNVYETLLKTYAQTVRVHKKLKYVSHTSWFVFSLIIRSMALHYDQQSELKLSRSMIFDASVIDSLSSLIEGYCKSFAGNPQNMLYCSIFIRDLFSLMEPSAVFPLINIVLSYTTDNYVSKLMLVEIVSRYEFNRALDFPDSVSSLSITDFESVQDYVMKLKEEHLIAGMIIDFVEETNIETTLLEPNVKRAMAIRALREVIQSHEESKSCQSLDTQTKIATAYFPFFYLIVNTLQAQVTALQGDEKNDWLMIFLYMTRYCNQETFGNWIKNEEVKNKRLFFLLLEECQRNFKNNPNMEYEVHLCILRSVTIYVTYCKELLAEGSGESLILNKILALIRRLLIKNLDSINTLIYRVLIYFWKTCSKGVLSSSDDVSESLTALIRELFVQMNSEDPSIRCPAIIMLQIMLEGGETTKSMSVIQGFIAIAVADIVGDGEDFENLSNSLDIIGKRITSDDTRGTAIKAIIDLAISLINYGEEIRTHNKDQEKLIDIYSNISKSLVEYPGIRLVWIDNMAKLHENNEDFVEAGQCKMFIACIIIQYLRKNGSWQLPESFEYFTSVCPNIKAIINERSFDLVSSDYHWTVKQVISKMNEAVQLFIKSTQYELALRTYSILSNIYVHENDFENMMKNLNQHAELCEKLSEPTYSGSVLSSCYFRIGFFGTVWGKYNGREYIYKRSQRYNLTAMKNELIDVYRSQFEDDKFEILLTNDIINIDNLDVEKAYIQLAGVRPYVSTEERLKKIGDFDINFNLNKLLFEATVRGPVKIKEDDIEHQKKKKTIFVTKYSFPHIKRRIRVAQQEEVVLSPIENSTELIKMQISRIQFEMLKKPPSINSLQQVIQGSVVPMVNPGPLLICDIFLNPERILSKEYNTELVRVLVQAMEDFLRFCFLALASSKNVMEEKHRKLQEMLEGSYEGIKARIGDAISKAKEALQNVK
eukprot:TRINITY_DN5866_c0_g1_i1.p1 TRINITY_DN5866_c0_g1~~TRINITY_DN5866_c0_g1_i1.p1  ORF type:complete len:956 (-),score=177.26 TRINITY_DN5866_c0_g1_i1:18-2885(-)